VTLPLPAAGTLVLTGKSLKTQRLSVDGSKAVLTLPVIPTGKARKALNRRRGKRKINRRKVALTVTYEPPANATNALSRKTALIKKKRTRKHRRQHGKRHGGGKR
jgi:hypothetical protein